MKISVQTTGVLDAFGIDAGMKAIADAGFEAVDLDLSIDLSYEEILACKESENYKDENIYPYLDAVKAAAEKYCVEIGQAHAPAPTYIKVSPESTEMMHGYIRKSIELCGYIGCPKLVIHPIFDGSARFPKYTKEEEYKINIDFYSSLIPLLKKHNVICCLENMWIQDWKSKKIYVGACSEVNEVISYIDELNGIAGEKRFGFCLDIGHLLLLGQDPCYWLERIGERIEALHTHDNDGVTDGHTLPYLGYANWDRFILGLRRIGYSGNISFETSPFNTLFPKELNASALNMIGAVGKYFVGRITAKSNETNKNTGKA
jgi:sugar phosphate isomerase/epimerase